MADRSDGPAAESADGCRGIAPLAGGNGLSSGGHARSADTEPVAVTAARPTGAHGGDVAGGAAGDVEGLAVSPGTLPAGRRAAAARRRAAPPLRRTAVCRADPTGRRDRPL